MRDAEKEGEDASSLGTLETDSHRPPGGGAGEPT